ncbi:MAG: AraC-like DNA-binding protein [Paracoccaceae bacterium]|jgi:AraC-like DNA-binding protein
MQASQLISHYIRTLLDTAVSAGWDAKGICQKVDVSLDDVLDDGLKAQIRFSPEQLAIIVHEISARDDYLGQLPGVRRTGVFELMSELVLSSETLREALHRGFRYYDMVSDVQSFSLHIDGNEARLGFRLNHPDGDPNNLLKEWWPRMWHRFSGWLIGGNIPLTGISFTHTNSAPVSEYEQVFACPCRFNQPEAYLGFEAKWLDLAPIRHADELQAYFTFSRLDLVSLPVGEFLLTQRLAYSLHEYFLRHQAFPGLGRVAGELSVSSQTLRRRLREEGTSYREMKTDVRKEIVGKLMKDKRLPLIEVARRSGFSDPGGLSRAVRKWVGLSPSEYRKLRGDQL